MILMFHPADIQLVLRAQKFLNTYNETVKVKAITYITTLAPFTTFHFLFGSTWHT